MEIASVRAAAVTNPNALAPQAVAPLLTPWTEFEGHDLSAAPNWPEVACVVTATDGTWGFGSTAFAGPVVPMINEHLAAIAVGARIETTAEREALWDRMDRACGAHYGTAGLASFAISAVDLAVWDLAGKLRNEPVTDLLGGPMRSSVPTYATGSAVEAYVELGHRAVKLPCEWGEHTDRSIQVTAERVHRARRLIGPDVDLMLDAWPVLDVDDAIALGRATTPFDLRWLEDAIFPEDWAGYERLRAALPDQPLAAGERWYTHRPFEQIGAAGAVDVFQPDPLWAGGVTAIRRIAALAERFQIELALHCGGNDPFGQHLSMALPQVEVAEIYFGDSPDGPLPRYRAFAGTAIATDGRIGATQAPGFGLEFTLDDVERAC